MRDVLTTILMTWRGRVIAAVGLVLVIGGLVLAYKAGQMHLFW